MRIKSQYPGLERKLQGFLYEMSNASEDFDEDDFISRVFEELQSKIPNFDYDQEKSSSLFQLIDNRLGLKDQFTVNEIRDIVRVMICIGYYANAINSEGERLLSIAIAFGDPKVVESLIEGGATVNTTTTIARDSNETILLRAAYGYGLCNEATDPESKENYFEIVKVLMKAGAKKEQVLESRSELVTEEMRQFITDIYAQHEYLQIAAAISKIRPPAPVIEDHTKVTHTKTQKQKTQTRQSEEKTSDIPPPPVKKETLQEKFNRLFNALVGDAEVLHSRSGKARGQCGRDWEELFPLIKAENIDTIGKNFSVMNLAILFGSFEQLQSLVNRKPENLNLPGATSVLSSAAIGTNVAMRDFLLKQNLTVAVVQSGFEEAVRSGTRGGNQGFAEKILEAVRNAAKSPEVSKRTGDVGKLLFLGESTASLTKEDALKALNNKNKPSGKSLKPQIISDYCSVMQKIFPTKDLVSASQAQTKKTLQIPVDPTVVHDESRAVKSDGLAIIGVSSQVVSDKEVLSDQDPVFHSDVTVNRTDEPAIDILQQPLSDEFYEGLKAAGIDFKRDFAGLFSASNSGLLPPDEVAFEPDNFTAIIPDSQLQKLSQVLEKTQQELEEEQQVASRNGLRRDAPAFIPASQSAAQLVSTNNKNRSSQGNRIN